MTKPFAPQDLFAFWTKLYAPGNAAFREMPFATLDAASVERRIAELEVVSRWLQANQEMLKYTIQGLEYQRSMLRGTERAREAFAKPEGAAGANPWWPWTFAVPGVTPVARPKAAEPVPKASVAGKRKR
jgi:hypothetical protein